MFAVASSSRPTDPLQRRVLLLDDEESVLGVLSDYLRGPNLEIVTCREIEAAEALRRAMAQVIAQEPLAQADYISVADSETLEELTTIDRPALASLAVHIGSTRLIDNCRLTPRQREA